MTETEAKRILGATISDDAEWGLVPHGNTDWIEWQRGEDDAQMDGFFTADQLEAIAWVMRNG